MIQNPAAQPVRSSRTRNDLGEAVALFAHHDPTGRVQPYVLHYVRALTAAGYRVHLARSGERSLDAADREALAGAGASVYQRRNAGLDFGAWQDLIAAGAAVGAGEILLANDSVLGPFAPLRPIRHAMGGFDAWGMVSSREGRRHLQSWFVSMTASAFARPAVRRVFAQDFASMGKAEIIVHGELGLSAAFEAEGLDVGARYVDRVRPSLAGLIPTNPSHFRWRTLLADDAVPFIKLELIRDNPSRVLDAAAWEGVLAARGVSIGRGELGAALAPRPRDATDRAPLGWRGALFLLALHDRPVRAAWDGWRAARRRG